MKSSIFKKTEYIRNKLKDRRRRRRLIVLASLVVFITTYALILPAITLETQAAQEMSGVRTASGSTGGVYVESSSSGSDGGSSSGGSDGASASSDTGSSSTAGDSSGSDASSGGASSDNGSGDTSGGDTHEPAFATGESAADDSSDNGADDTSGGDTHEPVFATGETLGDDSDGSGGDTQQSGGDTNAPTDTGDSGDANDTGDTDNNGASDAEGENGEDDGTSSGGGGGGGADPSAQLPVISDDRPTPSSTVSTAVFDADEYVVTVMARDGARLPEGAKLVVTQLEDDSDEYTEYSDVFADTLSEADIEPLDVSTFVCYKIEFLVDGEPVVPDGPVDVKIDYRRNTVKHGGDCCFGLTFTQTPEKSAAHFVDRIVAGIRDVPAVTLDSETEVITRLCINDYQIQDEYTSGVIALAAAQFDEDDAALIHELAESERTERGEIEYPAPTDEDENEPPAVPEQPEEPKQPELPEGEYDVHTVEGVDFTLTARVPAEAGIPADARLEVADLDDSEYADYFKKTKKALGGAKINAARYFDISFVVFDEETGKHEVLIPAVPVQITLELSIAEKYDIVKVISFTDDAEVIEGVYADGDRVTFEVREPSVYGVLYMPAPVRTENYGISSGEKAVLSDMFEKLGIDAEMKDVASVEASDPETITVKEQRPVLGFIGSVKWTIKCSASFEEPIMLTVTMNDGMVYEIMLVDEGRPIYELVAEGETYRITMSYNDAAQIPEGASLSVREIDPESEEYAEYAGRTADTLGSDMSEDRQARFFDITIMYEGGEIQPAAPVDVKIDLIDVVNVTEPQVLHFAEEEGAVLESAVEDAEEGTAVTFATDGFSVFGVTYTVDIYLELNGQTFIFSFPGGGFVSFGHLAEALSLAYFEGDGASDEDGAYAELAEGEGDIPEDGAASDEYDPDFFRRCIELNNIPVSEDTKRLVSDIASVEFSNPELIWVGKMAEDTTVGALKDENGLDIQYSEGLTDELIEEINAQTVESGDWALISLKPFDTEETLTITMKNGDVFTIRVTDAMYTGTALNLSNLDGATVAMVRTLSGPTNAVLDIQQNATHLQSVDVTIDSGTNQISTPAGVDLTEWTFERVSGTSNQFTIRSSKGYLNIGAGSATVSSTNAAQPFVIQTNGSRIRIKRVNDNYALNNDANLTANGYASWNGSSDGWQNPGEWFTLYELSAPNVPHVTVHYVKRDGTVIDDMEYTGTNPLVVKNADGTFTIPYNRNGQTTQTSVDLNTQFTNSNYTYANTHLDGVDASGDHLYQNGLIIDSVLNYSGNTLYFLSDSGETQSNVQNNPPIGNVGYGSLQSFDLSQRVSRRPTNSGSILPYSISNNKDIYVIMDPLPSSSGGSSSGGISGLDADPPSLEKTMAPNDDGTYTLSLKVDAHADGGSVTNKANILFVVDTSSSMRYPTTSGHNRIIDTHDAVKSLGDRLLSYNQTHPGAVEVAMITFDGGVYERQGWTSNQATFDASVDEYLRYYWMHQGTDWEDSLDAALTKIKTGTDSDPTFVVFFTDGEPSQYTNFHGAGTNTKTDYGDPQNGNSFSHENVVGSYPNYYSYYLCRESAKDEMRAIVDSGAMLFGVYAYNPDSGNYNGENGAALLHNGIKYGYNSSTSVDGKYYFNASNTTGLESAFNSIFDSITEAVGITNVVVRDGISADVTSSTVVDGDVSGFTYTIYDKTGAVAYRVKVAPNGVPSGMSVSNGTPIFTLSDGTQHVGETRSITVKKILKNSNGDPILDGNGKIQAEDVTVDVYYYKDTSTDREYIMPVSTTGENIVWDLSPLGILEDGYSYELSFIVWPNQDAYDLVVDLNNGKRPDLVQDWANADGPRYDSNHREYYKGGVVGYPYICRYTDNGVFAVQSNTDQSLDYFKVHKKVINGQEITEYDGPHNFSVSPPAPMPLESSRSLIQKQWNTERDPGIFAKYLYNIDGTSKEFVLELDVFKDTDPSVYKHITLGWDSTQNKYVWAPNSTMVPVVYAGRTYQIGNLWSLDFTIATGLMLSETRMNELGLNKSLYPSSVYEGVTYYVLETGHDYTIKETNEGTIGYEFDFKPVKYHPMLVDNVMKSVELTKVGNTVTINKIVDISSIEDTPSTLTIENTLRAYINVNKVVLDQDNNAIPNDLTKFQYSLTLDNPDSPGPFTGDSIPWYGISGLFYNDGNMNYYQLREAEVDGSTIWRITNESGETFNVISSGFDPNIATAQSVTYRVSATETVTLDIYGNQMTATADGRHASANIAISQNETLSIANVPGNTVFSLTEGTNASYDLVSITSDHPSTISGRSISATVVPNEVNHVTYTNKLRPGSLKFQKIVQIDGRAASTAAEYALVDGDYIFTVTSADGVSPAVSKYVQITVANGAAASYKIADSQAGLASASSTAGSWAMLTGLGAGDYVITELDERNGLMLSGISRGDDSDTAVDFENSRVTVHVTRDDTAASNTDAQASFTNGQYNNDGPDKISLDIVKTMTGLLSESDIPDDFQLIISFNVPGSGDPQELTLVKNQDTTVAVGSDHVRIKETTSGYTLSWHITGIPSDATNFRIKEANYGSVAGYRFVSATLDGSDVTSTAGDYHNMAVTAPAATLSDVTSQRQVSTSSSSISFYLEDGDIILSKLTANQGTLVISKTSLNTMARAAVENGWPTTAGFKKPPKYFSIEEHPDGFQFGGKQITFSTDSQGRTIVVITSNASAQDYAYAVSYASAGALNNAAYVNTYEQLKATLELIKVNAQNRSETLPNAQFKLIKLDPNGRGSYLTGSGAVERTSGVTGANGAASISGITEGFYEIIETKIPNGYINVDDEKFYIKVHNGAITRIEKITTDDPLTTEVDETLVKNWADMSGNTGNIRFESSQPADYDDPSTPGVDESAEAKTTYSVGNTPGTELPSTGGIGAGIFYVIGAIMMLAGTSAAVLGRRRRTRR